MTEVKSYCYNLVMIVPFMKTQVVNDLINSLLESNKRYSILLVLVDMSLEKDGLIAFEREEEKRKTEGEE